MTGCLGQMIMRTGKMWLGPGLAFQPEIRPGGLQLVDLEGSAEIGQAQLQKGKCVSKLTVLRVTPDSQLSQGNDVSGAGMGLSVTGLSPGQELAGDLPAAPDGNHF